VDSPGGANGRRADEKQKKLRKESKTIINSFIILFSTIIVNIYHFFVVFVFCIIFIYVSFRFY